VKIIYTDNGFIFRSGETVGEFIWSDITQINIFKRDLMTEDQIVMELIFGGEAIRLTEDNPYFKEFTDTVENIFPIIPKDWYDKVIAPAFATNFRTIYFRL
jgi:hypothetical protein